MRQKRKLNMRYRKICIKSLNALDDILYDLLEAYNDTENNALNYIYDCIYPKYDKLFQDFSRHDSRYREIAMLCRDVLDDATIYTFNEFLKCENKENERYLSLHDKAVSAYCNIAQLIKERENDR